MKLVITIEGGLVQDIYTDSKEGVSILIADFDTDFQDEERMITIPSGEPYWCGEKAVTYECDRITNVSFVDKLFNLVRGK